MSTVPPPAASAAERELLAHDFVRLCEIASPSRDERAMADAVAAELADCGIAVEEDGSRAATGSNCGNLLGRVPAPEGAPTILLCAHLDTVPLDAPVEVSFSEGRYENANAAILGADNKAAVVALLAIARRSARKAPPVGIEFLFTTCEELALLGARELGHELSADFGFVFDHASPIGELIVAAPTYYRVHAQIHGAAAHAGIRPEDGRNAIVAAARGIASLRSGRLGPDTTSNVGRIDGGTNANVVAERCNVELEARSLDDDEAGRVVGEMVDAFAEAASDAECDVDTTVERLFRAYRLQRSSPPVQVAAAALEAHGIEPVYVTTGGASDANALIENGIPVLNVANATERNHQPDEAVTADALETMLDVAIGIVDRSAEVV